MGLKEIYRSRQRKLLVWIAVVLLVIVSGSILVMAKITTYNAGAYAQQNQRRQVCQQSMQERRLPSVTVSPSPSLLLL